ncbi:unnamed protein product [Cyclocybe aegerita]|uniref:Uncharacterized protein n=1 Tax=Cyclocybe aegerita TaxID=1973307 RepID=A0A8S0WQB9_CYCAE|nr:unnamed protein product [Cyclocybe aegerita]
MFSLPKQPHRDGESTSEDNPLILHDSPSDFSALCSALSAPPLVILAQSDPLKVNIRALIGIFHIANKYQFVEYENWASQLLTSHSCANGGTAFEKCTIEDLKRILCVASAIRLGSLISNMISIWLRRLRSDPTLSTKDALNFSESLNLRNFQGHVYYAEVARMKIPPHATKAAGVTFPVNGFNDAQNQCLYRGFWRLTAFWESLKVPIFKPDPPPAHTECIQRWQSMWMPDPNNNALLDPLGRLQRLSGVNLLFISCGITHCLKDSKSWTCPFADYAPKLSQELHSGMADYILGPPAPSSAESLVS